MPLGTEFKEIVADRVRNSAEFRRLVFERAARDLLNGDLGDAKLALRDYVNGTIGFQALGSALGKKPESLMRMLSPVGNPTSANLVAIIQHLRGHERIAFEVTGVETGVPHETVPA